MNESMSSLEPPRTGRGVGLHRTAAVTADLDLALAIWENEGGRESWDPSQDSPFDTGFGRSPMGSRGQVVTGDGE